MLVCLIISIVDNNRWSGSRSVSLCGLSHIRSWSFPLIVAWLSQWSMLCPFIKWRSRVSSHCLTTSCRSMATTLQRPSLLHSGTLCRAVQVTVSSATCCRLRTGEDVFLLICNYTFMANVKYVYGMLLS